MTKLNVNMQVMIINLVITLSVTVAGGVTSWWKTISDLETKSKKYIEDNYTNKYETKYISEDIKQIKISVKEMREDQKEMRDILIRKFK